MFCEMFIIFCMLPTSTSWFSLKKKLSTDWCQSVHWFDSDQWNEAAKQSLMIICFTTEATIKMRRDDFLSEMGRKLGLRRFVRDLDVKGGSYGWIGKNWLSKKKLCRILHAYRLLKWLPLGVIISGSAEQAPWCRPPGHLTIPPSP